MGFELSSVGKGRAQKQRPPLSKHALRQAREIPVRSCFGQKHFWNSFMWKPSTLWFAVFFLIRKNNFWCWKWDLWEEVCSDSSTVSQKHSINSLEY